jgi:hypothetical protein
MLYTLKNASLTGAFFLLLVLFVPAARADECLDRTWVGTIGDIRVTAQTAANRNCEDQVSIAWKSLTPFLSRLGIQSMKRLQGHK